MHPADPDMTHMLGAGRVPQLCPERQIRERSQRPPHPLHGQLRGGDVWPGHGGLLPAGLHGHQAAGSAAARRPGNAHQGRLQGGVLLADCQLPGAVGQGSCCPC